MDSADHLQQIPLILSTEPTQLAEFGGGTSFFWQLRRFGMKFQHSILLQNVTIAIGFYHKHQHFKEHIKLFQYLMIGMNGESPKMQDIVLANLLHLTDPECTCLRCSQSIIDLIQENHAMSFRVYVTRFIKCVDYM